MMSLTDSLEQMTEVASLKQCRHDKAGAGGMVCLVENAREMKSVLKVGGSKDSSR